MKAVGLLLLLVLGCLHSEAFLLGALVVGEAEGSKRR